MKTKAKPIHRPTSRRPGYRVRTRIRAGSRDTARFGDRYI